MPGLSSSVNRFSSHHPPHENVVWIKIVCNVQSTFKKAGICNVLKDVTYYYHLFVYTFTQRLNGFNKESYKFNLNISTRDFIPFIASCIIFWNLAFFQFYLSLFLNIDFFEPHQYLGQDKDYYFLSLFFFIRVQNALHAHHWMYQYMHPQEANKEDDRLTKWAKEQPPKVETLYRYPLALGN